MPTATDDPRRPIPRPTVPNGIRAVAAQLLGPIDAVERLGGMSGSRVFLVRGLHGRAVAKGAVSSVETEVYRSLAPTITACGVGIPDLLWSGTIDGERWLLIEAIPTPLPRERHGPDPGILATLARLHASGERVPPLRSADAFRPRWDTEMTDRALRALGPDAVGVASILRTRQVESIPLFAACCFISGDPNPANWGLRANGVPILFDWERCCRATPPLDLAPLIPGLGCEVEFRGMAAAYAALPGAVTVRPRALLLAKTWNVVELLAGITAGQTRADHLLPWLRAEVPSWLRADACGP